MARRVYFAFHYKDVANFRVNVIRNSWLTKSDREAAGFYDASLWEKAKKESDLALKRLINGGLYNTSVTAVLAGSETYSRRWVRYEIIESFKKGNGLLNIYIHQILDKNRQKDSKGGNPLDFFYFRIDSMSRKIHIWEYTDEWVSMGSIPSTQVSYNFGKLTEGKFSALFPSYDWVDNDGYNNFSTWVDKAAAQAGK
jgi:hypothetical protein